MATRPDEVPVYASRPDEIEACMAPVILGLAESPFR